MKHKLMITLWCLLWIGGCTSTPANNSSSPLLNKLKQQELQAQLDQHIEEYQSVKPSIERLVELEGDLRVLVAQIAAFKPSDDLFTQVNQDNDIVSSIDDTDSSIDDTDSSIEDTDLSIEDAAIALNPATTIPDINDIDITALTVDTQYNSGEVVTLKPQKSTVTTMPLPSVGVPSEALQSVKPPQSNQSRIAQCEPQGAQPNANEFGVHVSSFNRQDLVLKGWHEVVSQYPRLCQKSAVIQRVQVKDKLFYSLRVGPYKDKAEAKEFCKTLRSNRQYCRVTDFMGEQL